jgi:hypothetical protein
MPRAFRKWSRDLVNARTTRARRPTRLRPALDALEGRMLLSFDGSETLINPPSPAAQFNAVNASSANGTSVAVWIDGSTAFDHILAQRYDRTGAKAGPVITVEAGAVVSTEPSVAMDAQGNFVVAWTDFTNAVQTVRARYYSASGSPLTAAFNVSANFAHESEPSVAASNGSFVIAYTINGDSPNADLWAHRYTVSGGVVHDISDFSVASSASFEKAPKVAMAPSGAFDIAYDVVRSGTNVDILLNRYSSSGAALASGEVVANSAMTEKFPGIAMDAAGNAVVAYEKLVGSDFDIKARRVTAAGSVGGEINIISNFAQEEDASVALAPSGGQFVVAYTTDVSEFEVAEVSGTDAVLQANGPVGVSPGEDATVSVDGFDRYLVTYTESFGGNFDTFSRRALLPSFGGSETQVNPPSQLDPFQAATASSTNGTSVVVWVDDTGGNANIFAQRYDMLGAKLGPVITVDGSAAVSFEPKVAMDAQGNFVVAWTDFLSNGGENVLARAFNASGIPRTGLLAVTGSSKAEAEFEPVVAASVGSFVVAYTENLSSTVQILEVRAHRYTVAGGIATDAGDFPVSNLAGFNESHPSVAMAPNGAFDIAYQFGFSATDDDIRLSRYSASGALLQSNVIIAGSGALEQNPDIAMDNAGNAVIVYQKFRSDLGRFTIEARRLSSSGVESAEIDVPSTQLDNTHPKVALAPTGGQFVVVYETGNQLGLVEMSATNSQKGGFGPFDGFDPSISIDGLGRYTVTYTKGPDGAQQIFKRRDFLS